MKVKSSLYCLLLSLGITICLISGCTPGGGNKNQDGKTSKKETPASSPSTGQKATGTPPDNTEATSDDQRVKKEGKTITELATSKENLTYFRKAIQEVMLSNILDSEGPFTVFVPRDLAFKALPQGKWDSLMNHPDQLSALLKYHVVSGEHTTNKLVDKKKITTVQGQEISVAIGNEGALVNDARIVNPNVQASNGVIHIISKVLTPENQSY